MLERSKRIRLSEEDRKNRIKDLRERTGLKLHSYATTNIDARSVSGNIENFIGTVSIPVGLAGPLQINFKNSSEEVYATIATTEGALVSSIHRGAIAINVSGGVQARVIKNQMIRAPQFEFASIDDALNFGIWIEERFEHLQSLVQRKSSHAKLTKLDVKNFGRTVHVRFIYSTGNAAGQNMTSFCTAYLCQQILSDFTRQTGIEILNHIIEGNLSSDKKASMLSAIEGRGRTVIAECLFKENALKRIFKISSDEIISRFSRSKSARIMSGQIGFNINVANVVAGLFLATGQDAACIHESAIAELHLEKHEGGLYACLYMPSLVVGTIGGGTQLPGFKENLQLMGCDGADGAADRLAEIIASFSLALELSTVAAIGTGHFVSAHENIARLGAAGGLKLVDINEEFFKVNLDNKNISRVEPIEAINKQGFLTDIAQQVSKKVAGFLAYEIRTNSSSKKAFLKLKSHEREIVLGAAKVIEVIRPGIAEILLQKRNYLPFKDSHIREIEFLSSQNLTLADISPKFLGSFVDDEKEAFVLIQELLDDGFNISEIDKLDLWTEQVKENCVRQIARLHAEFFNRRDAAFALSKHLIDLQDTSNVDDEVDLWDALYSLSYLKIKNEYANLSAFYEKSLENFQNWRDEMARLPHTCIHYDFNPRNIAFKQNDVKIFDWEFAAWGLPQRDLVEFVIFTATPESVVEDLAKCSQLHFEQLPAAEMILWQKGLEYSLREFVVKRLPFYFVLSEFSFCAFVDRLLANLDVLSAELNK